MNQGLLLLNTHSQYSLLIIPLKNQMRARNSGLKMVVYQVH